VDPPRLRAAERAIERAEQARADERGILVRRARRLVGELGGTERGARVLGRADEIERAERVRSLEVVRELIDRAGAAWRRRLGVVGVENPIRHLEPRRSYRRGGALALEVADVSDGEILADYAPDLAAAWRSLGGSSVAIMHPASGRSWRCESAFSG
jgi:hypothetical protein